ncbi:putative non-specific serine/threonine protein kinase [Helianthus annuus]|uniref:Non-specific serine/threonine protein kinase n=1 Tax=Helianthus annuus TaxID=4232 RepID=A0A251S0P8_HELAN|nr:receptor-like protein 4 [Helianthus annuus]KAF5760734.1 putative non-specific serine/threonine protein kinase [Helianthus annuus]KAJ0438718.1 putative non-specific serine/threonine protein kinase [Helianthus annuus]KAJ0443594.1 putative non-specific serine/threonine protein kinase [Helianthus annuus]KAJ0461071.1 putative non-specific serine/threonine protein kinase [Helianthus annuus]KAJ0641496.1 putative non-specific serine/threonine protein kinase [Helianthus annuus]
MRGPLSLLIFLIVFVAAFTPSHQAPYALRISCGARNDVHTPPTNTLWYRDFGYSGGYFTNATRPSFITPPLQTVRYFPLSEGPENCYHIERVPHGHYSIRIFFGLVKDPTFDNEPLFDVSIEGTLVYSMQSGWSNHDDEQAFVESIVFLEDGTASICFHSTGHGDPAVLSIEILQVGNNAYNFGPGWGRGTILRTHKRLSCGAKNPKFDVDYSGDHWGGDRFWNSVPTFGQSADRVLTTKNTIKLSSKVPNYYPEALYQTALISTDNQPDLAYTMDVDPNRNYSIWLHFAEIDSSVTGEGQRVFDVLINGDTEFQEIDIVKMSGGVNSALVLNKTILVSGRSLTITLNPVKGSHTIISAIEVFEIVNAEAKTLIEEVRALQKLKSALGLPLRFGWNGDPCVPQQHPWSGVDCQFDSTKLKWFIDGLGLDNQGLRGFLPEDISKLSHLEHMNLSENSIRGHIPLSLGKITSLQVLDLSYNFFNGSIPESLGGLTSVRILNLNGNSLSGRVPAALGARLLHRASFNFTDNDGLCGIPGLPTCGPHLSASAKIGIALGACAGLLLIATCLTCWWKRRQNILRTQQIAARGAPYAKARTHYSRDVQLTRHNNGHENARTAAENGPILLS